MDILFRQKILLPVNPIPMNLMSLLTYAIWVFPRKICNNIYKGITILLFKNCSNTVLIHMTNILSQMIGILGIYASRLISSQNKFN